MVFAGLWQSAIWVFFTAGCIADHRTVVLKVFYHLGELDDALTYALGAGNLFDINEQSEYVQTILGKDR